MKRWLKLAAAGAALAACGMAMAAGPYDGVYRIKYSDTSWGDFISVHSNGVGHMQIWKYRAPDPSSGAYFEVRDGANTVAKMWKFGNFDLFGGPITGNTATLTGWSQFGACNSTVTAVFSGGVTGNTIQTVHTGASAFGASISALCLNFIPLLGGSGLRFDQPVAMERQYP